MIDLELFRRIVTAGDLADRLLINQIKIERFDDEEKIASLQEENHHLSLALDILRGQVPNFDTVEYEESLRGLKSVLYEQWDQLEIVHDGGAESGEAAIRSQLLNVDRVKWKNEINRLFGSSQELKDYATKHRMRK